MGLLGATVSQLVDNYFLKRLTELLGDVRHGFASVATTGEQDGLGSVALGNALANVGFEFRAPVADGDLVVTATLGPIGVEKYKVAGARQIGIYIRSNLATAGASARQLVEDCLCLGRLVACHNLDV